MSVTTRLNRGDPTQGTAATPLNLSVVGTARNTCCNPNSTLTYTIGEAGVINNLSTKIGKE